MQVETYNGQGNLTAFPSIVLPLSLNGTPYQGLLFPAGTEPRKGFSLGSYDLIFDRVVAAESTGRPFMCTLHRPELHHAAHPL